MGAETEFSVSRCKDTELRNYIVVGRCNIYLKKIRFQLLSQDYLNLLLIVYIFCESHAYIYFNYSFLISLYHILDNYVNADVY